MATYCTRYIEIFHYQLRYCELYSQMLLSGARELSWYSGVPTLYCTVLYSGCPACRPGR